MVERFMIHLWAVALEASPWLLFGLVISGMIKVWMPADLLRRWVGGHGLRSIVNAALLGTPLPLCSCSVIPAAVTLRRAGASKEATVSFLVATPENGADSIALTYAMLGPFMTVVRPVAAIFSAIWAGVLTWWMVRGRDQSSQSNHVASLTIDDDGAHCCGDQACGKNGPSEDHEKTTVKTSWKRQAYQVVRYAVGDLYADIAFWLILGLVLAAMIQTFVPPDAMVKWGSGLPAMLGMLLIGVPMYICATASTPVAAAMLLAGVSPGTVLVFLLAGPATNLGSIGIIRREMGNRVCAAYLIGACSAAVACGLFIDWLVRFWDIAVLAQVEDHNELIPQWVAIAALIILGSMTGWHLWQWLRRKMIQHR